MLRDVAAALDSLWADAEGCEAALARGKYVSIAVTVRPAARGSADVCLSILPYDDDWSLVRGLAIELTAVDDPARSPGAQIRRVGWDGTTTFPGVLGGRYRFALAAASSAAIPAAGHHVGGSRDDGRAAFGAIAQGRSRPSWPPAAALTGSGLVVSSTQTRAHCWLKEILEERKVTPNELTLAAKVPSITIKALQTNQLQSVSLDDLGKIAAALGIGIDRLVCVYPENIWLPIVLRREVTIHLGADSFVDRFETPSGEGASGIDRLMMGFWDVQAASEICRYLNRLGVNVNVDLRVHLADEEGDPVGDAFKKGNHIILGSPVANRFCEGLVAGVFGAASSDPQQRSRFPYEFVWGAKRARKSSFGRVANDGKLGIGCTRTGNLVAPRTLVSEGQGEDCALVVAHRVALRNEERFAGHNLERVVLAFVGHSGPGTLAAARVAMAEDAAAELYPSRPERPLMGVVRAIYERPSSTKRDNRKLVTQALVDVRARSEEQAPAPRDVSPEAAVPSH